MLHDLTEGAFQAGLRVVVVIIVYLWGRGLAEQPDARANFYKSAAFVIWIGTVIQGDSYGKYEISLSHALGATLPYVWLMKVGLDGRRRELEAAAPTPAE